MELNYADPATRSIVSLSTPVFPGWTINRVSVLPPHRGQGIARSLMAQVIEDADDEGVNLWLEVRPDASGTGLTFRQLFEWYSRLGFQPIDRVPVMVRLPRKAPAWTLEDAQRMMLDV